MLIERKWKKWIFFYLPMTVFILFTLFPFYWMAVTAMRPDGELYRTWRQASATPFWTLEPTLEHFRDLLQTTAFPHWRWNTMLIAIVSTVISLICDMHLGNTPWALMLTYPTFLIPFCTWLLMGYFKTIPKELEECARIDGATRFR